MSTPLHWAGFSGADLTLNYILSWGGDTEMRDSKGLTPLHLAVKSAKEHRSTKGVKQLLIKGADRNALDNAGMKPVDYMPLPVNKQAKDGKSNDIIDPMILDIRNVLRDEWTILGDCLMIRNTFKAQRKSPFTLICYFVLMGLTFGLLHVSSYQALRLGSPMLDWLLYGSQGLFGASIVNCIVVWLSNPGIIKKDKELDFIKLLDTMEASSLCPDCEIIRTPRCRHCNLCNACVDRYDHHCPWVNNCIGKGNFAQFYTFIVVQSLYLFSIVVVSVFCKYT